MNARMACRCGIDTHAHFVPEHFPRYLGATAPVDWPSMAPAHACHRNVMISGRIYRTVSDRCWNTARRLDDLAQMGLALQVLSPMPELLSYWMQADDAQQLLRYLNEQLAATVAESEGQLAGLAAVPLQDTELAIRELEHAVSRLGLAGVEVGSNINGRPIGAPEFEPFFAACVELGAAVFVHAIRPAGMDRLIGPPPLQQVLGYPGEIGLAAASVLTSNLIERHPDLRIAFSHGGGTLAMLLPRLQQGWKVFPAVAEAMAVSPREQAGKLFFDTLTFDPPTLHHLVSVFGASQLMIGTDYPFNFHDRAPVDSVDAAGFDAATRDLLLHANARRFLQLPEPEQP